MIEIAEGLNPINVPERDLQYKTAVIDACKSETTWTPITKELFSGAP